MNILYIANSRNLIKPYQDSSVRYRCFNPAEAFAAANINADVTTINMVTLNLVERYDLIIFHRPSMSRKLEKLVSKAKQRNCAVMADFDDLIFNPDYAEQSPTFLNEQNSLDRITASLKKRNDALFLFDYFSVSTFPLSKEIKKIKPLSEVTVIHNYLSDEWLQLNDQSRSRESEIKRITYLCGSNSHDDDFSLVQDLLIEFLSDNSDVVLRIVGPLKFTKKYFKNCQLELQQYVSYPFLPRIIEESWVTIAPLANTIFNNCKSGLKYFESACFGIPVIATPIDDMQRLNSEALHLADTPDQWLQSLNTLSDKKYYEQCAASGANHVKETCVISHQKYVEALSNFIV